VTDQLLGQDVSVGAALERSPTPIAGRLGGQAVYILAGNLFTLAVGFPLQIYVSRRLGSSGLGTYSLLEGISATVAGLLGLGLAPTALRFIPQYLEEGDHASIRRLILRGALALSVLGLVGYGIFLLFCLGLSQATALRADAAAVVLMGALIPIGLLSHFAQQSLRGFHEIRYLIAGSSFVQLSVKAIATIVLFALGARLAGYALATAIAGAVAVLWLGAGLGRKLRALWKLPQGPQSKGRWRRYAAISYATSLISLPASYLDRFLLGVFVGAGPVGVLVVARQLQQLPGALYQMLISVAAPMFASAHARDARTEQEHLYALITDWAVKAAFPLIVFIGLFAHPVLSLFGPQFADAGTLPVRILMVAQLFNLASGPNGNVAAMCGLEREAFHVDIAMMIATALLLALLVPTLGLTGAALSVLANSLGHNSWTLLIVRNKLDIRWWDRRYLRWVAPAAISAFVGVVAGAIVQAWNAPMLLLTLVGMYGAFAAITLLQGLHDDDRALIAHLKKQFAG